MAWLAVNPSGREYIFHNKPVRVINKNNELYNHWCDEETYDYIRGMTTSAEDYSILLPKGTIKKITGKKITWENEPIKIKYNYE